MLQSRRRRSGGSTFGGASPVPCCVRRLSSMQVCAAVCGPVARLGGQVIGPAAGNGCLHARGLLEGAEKPWATGKGVRCAEIQSAGLDGVSRCPSSLGVRLKGGITPHSIQSMLAI